MSRTAKSKQGKKSSILQGIVIGHADGFGFFAPDGGGDDIYLSPKQMRTVLHGDRISVKLGKPDKRGRPQGKIVDVVKPAHTHIIGKLVRDRGVRIVVPHDKKISQDMLVSPPKKKSKAELKGIGKIKVGDTVVAQITEQPGERGYLRGEIREIIGGDQSVGMKTDIAIRSYDLPHRWPDSVESQLVGMGHRLKRVRTNSSRQDLRTLPLVTIDGEDARDFDDAVFAEADGKNWRLLVAIADVSHYVSTSCPLDNEALIRGNSVYFPDRVLPMLPEALSNGICSLNPQVDRFCMVCEMRINQTGDIKHYSFYEAVMRSAARLTYTETAAMLGEGKMPRGTRKRAVLPALQNLQAVFKLLQQGRVRRGAIDFDFPEPHIQLGSDGKIETIVARERNDAHKLIEECMLAANICAAGFLQKHYKKAGVYRVHEGPAPESLLDLRKFLGGFKLELGGEKSPSSADYARVLEALEERPEIAGMVQTVLLRSLSQAVYAAENKGHFALGYDAYTHFTSPIRRYPDLIVHRMIKAALAVEAQHTTTQKTSKNTKRIQSQNKASELNGQFEVSTLIELNGHCSHTERRAEEATRDVVGRLKAEFMLDKIGEQFEATVSGVTDFGVFVQLDSIFIEGLVHVTSLGNDYFRFDAGRHCLIGDRTGQRFRLGDRLSVKLVRVDPEDAKIDFEPANMKKSPKTAKAKRNPRGRKFRGRK